MPLRDVTYLDARPSIEVGDLGAALAFWTDVVGFEVDTTMGEPPTFAMLSSRSAALALAECDEPAIPAIASVFVTMTGLDGLVERISAAGLTLESEPTTRPWGLRDLVVRCPGNGPFIAFGEQI
ncbi:MAG TPA: VOC family protein [Acidimicrobiales bacterium]|jgi:uncharacterized glyoxalase superfamily protein PhnB